MEHSRKYSWSLRRTPDGPLAPYVDGFEGRLSALGYAETSAHLYTRLAADFSRWLKQKTVAKDILDRSSTQLASLGNRPFIEGEMRAPRIGREN